MFSAGALVLAAAAVLLDPSLCKQSAVGKTGGAVWETDGKSGLSISMDARSTGEVYLRCRVKLDGADAGVVLRFDRALVSFQPAGTKTTGSGLRLEIGNCRGELLRIAGEDWIEAAHRVWKTTPPARSKHVEVRVALVDVSDRDPVRVDIRGLRVEPASGSAQACSP